MIEICAWCRKSITVTWDRNPGRVTHGICDPCADMLKKKYRMSSALNAADIETLIKFIAKGTTL